MSANPIVNDVRTYASDRVFNGTRRLSDAHVKRIQARYHNAPAKRRWGVLSFVVAAAVAVAHAVRLY
jgi:hypothetical protein